MRLTKNLLQTLTVRDTLVANISGIEATYDYRESTCQPVLPDSIRINSAFCAFICHSSYTIPIVCEDPAYNAEPAGSDRCRTVATIWKRIAAMRIARGLAGANSAGSSVCCPAAGCS